MDPGLPKALQNLCREQSMWEGIPVVFRAINLPPETSVEVTSSVYRIAQKTLTNVAKHVRAKHICAGLRRHRNLQLSIHNEGLGFDPDALRGVGRLGLVNSEERAHIADATLSINGRPNSDIRMKTVVPKRGATRENSTHFTGR